MGSLGKKYNQSWQLKKSVTTLDSNGSTLLICDFKGIHTEILFKLRHVKTK